MFQARTFRWRLRAPAASLVSTALTCMLSACSSFGGTSDFVPPVPTEPQSWVGAFPIHDVGVAEFAFQIGATALSASATTQPGTDPIYPITGVVHFPGNPTAAPLTGGADLANGNILINISSPGWSGRLTTRIRIMSSVVTGPISSPSEPAHAEFVAAPAYGGAKVYCGRVDHDGGSVALVRANDEFASSVRLAGVYPGGSTQGYLAADGTIQDNVGIRGSFDSAGSFTGEYTGSSPSEPITASTAAGPSGVGDAGIAAAEASADAALE
jgi:hypothetical protein